MPNPNAATAAFRPDQVLLQLDSHATPADHSRALEAIGGQLLDIIRGGGEGGGELARVSLGQGISVEKAIQILSHLPGVRFAEPDFIVSGLAVSNDAAVVSGTTWGLLGDEGSRVNAFGSQATEAWNAGAIGSTKVAVGVVDTGMDYTHPDLYLNVWLNQREIPLAFRSALSDVDADGLITFRDLNNAANGTFVSDINANGRIDAGDLLNDVRWENGLDDDANGYRDDLIGWDFVNNDNDPMDDQGHGTHVSGTIGAIGGNGIGVAGVAWSTQMVVLKFLDASSYGYTSNNIKAVDYFTNASKAGTGVDFVATNQSWGGAGYSQGLVDAITRGAVQDIFYVAAAGNNGADNDATPFYPASLSTQAALGYEAVISVAALTSTGALASFSNYGASTVDIAAPGASIYSTTRGGGYGTMSGTSMAAPHVTGALALYAAAHPGLTAAQIRAALLNSAEATASLLDKVATDGRLDVADFLNTVVEAPTSPPPVPPLATGVVILGTSGADSVAPGGTIAGQPLPTAYGDTLSGLAGADTLDGGGGADRLIGGLGNDTFLVDHAGDTIVELAGEGADTVLTALGHTLGLHLENLTLSGSANVAGVGNDLANTLMGNAGANALYGLAGSDRLDGAGGADSLAGGLDADTLTGGAGDDDLDGGPGSDLYVGSAGKDDFHFARGEIGGDAIQDFAKGDHILLHGYSAGSSVGRVAGSATDWTVTDAASGATEVFRLLNSYALKSGDFLFG